MEKPSIPIGVMVLAFILPCAALYFLLVILVGAIWSPSTVTNGVIIEGFLIFVLTQAASIGLVKMKRWALYLLMVASIVYIYIICESLGLPTSIISATSSAMQVLADAILPAVMLFYLWSIRKRFN